MRHQQECQFLPPLRVEDASVADRLHHGIDICRILKKVLDACHGHTVTWGIQYRS